MCSNQFGLFGKSSLYESADKPKRRPSASTSEQAIDSTNETQGVKPSNDKLRAPRKASMELAIDDFVAAAFGEILKRSQANATKSSHEICSSSKGEEKRLCERTRKELNHRVNRKKARKSKCATQSKKIAKKSCGYVWNKILGSL